MVQQLNDDRIDAAGDVKSKPCSEPLKVVMQSTIQTNRAQLRRIYLDAGYRGVQLVFKLWIERQSIGSDRTEILTLVQCHKLYNPTRRKNLWLTIPYSDSRMPNEDVS